LKCGVSTVNSDRISMKILFNTRHEYCNYSVFFLMVLVIFFAGSCKKSESGSPSGGDVSIPTSDIVGYGYKNSMRVAKYWKDGVVTYLSDSTKDTQLLSVSVSGNDVYIVGVQKSESGGYDWDNTKMPKFWKNGIAVGMNVFDFGVGVSKNTNGVAESVYALNGNAYIAGYMSDGGCNSSIAVLWTNGGTPTLLSSPYNGDSFATSVFVTSAGVIYVTGCKGFNGGNGNQAAIWVNGSEILLTDGTFTSEANSIFVSGSDVYVAGGIINTNVAPYWRAVYWKNGTINYLTDGSSFAMAYSIALNGNDIYVAGDFSKPGTSNSANATIWKNGTATNLTSNSGSAKSLFIKGSDVYVVGYKYYGSSYIATLWKNGTEFLLSNADKDFANGIFVR
jgi:hypothetical protein